MPPASVTYSSCELLSLVSAPAEPRGPIETKGVMDWRDVQDRLEDATPEKNLKPLLDSLPRSQRVLLVYPVTTDIGNWDAPWTSLVRRRAAQWGRALELDRRFEFEGYAPAFYRRSGRIGVRGVLYTKTSDKVSEKTG